MLPTALCRCDSAGQLLDANPALLAMLGFASAGELLGKHLGALYADARQWFELADHLRSAVPFNGLIVEWMRKDGSATEIRVSGRAVSDGGKERTFELFAEDVTERAPSSSNSGSRRKWRPSEDLRAALPTTSIIC